MDKTRLLLNQISYFKKIYLDKIESNNSELQKGTLTANDCRFSNKSMLGRISVLNDLIETDKNLIHTKLMDDFNLYAKQLKSLKVNLLDKEDPNQNLFYFLNGCICVSMLLMTVSENPLSACPTNKDILLSESLEKLKHELEIASKAKDAEKIKAIKEDIKITTDLYEKNLEIIKNETKIEV